MTGSKALQVLIHEITRNLTKQRKFVWFCVISWIVAGNRIKRCPKRNTLLSVFALRLIDWREI